jgi:actin-related protein 6
VQVGNDVFCVLSGLHQAGLGEAIVQSINVLPEDLQGMFWANIGLIGGSTTFPGFAARL